MTKLKLAFVCYLLTAGGAFAASCRVSDLQACLDSACNESLEQTSRCYLCGTSMAKKPIADAYALGDTPIMQSLAVGLSSKNTLSEKELKSAPLDPGKRYQWATKECLVKLKDCSTDDIADNYDKLIEQACKVALGDAEYATAMKKSQEKKTMEQCNAELSLCLLSESKCDGNMLLCETDNDFDRNFSACMVEASGCGEFMATLRGNMAKSRDDMVGRKDEQLSDLVKLRQMERQEKLEAAKRVCTVEGKNACVVEMCGNFPIGLDENGLCSDNEEKILATTLCKFVDTACNKLK